MKQLFLQRANARNQSIVLAMVCLVLLFTDIRYTYLQPVRAFAGTLTEPVFWLSELPSRLLEGMRVLSQDRSDRLGQLSALEQKIKVLEARQLKMSALASENRRLRELLGSSEKLDESVLIAEVVGISPDPARHYVMIDKGADDGSFIGQVVIDSTGLVGQVIETTASLSKVLLITISGMRCPSSACEPSLNWWQRVPVGSIGSVFPMCLNRSIFSKATFW